MAQPPKALSTRSYSSLLAPIWCMRLAATITYNVNFLLCSNLLIDQLMSLHTSGFIVVLECNLALPIQTPQTPPAHPDTLHFPLVIMSESAEEMSCQ